MIQFPRTQIDGLSMPRLIAGSNWFLGCSHTSAAKDRLIREMMTPERITDVLEVFMNAGVDALYGIYPSEKYVNAIREAEQRTGRHCIRIGIPSFNIAPTHQGYDEAARTLDTYAEIGTELCMPHQCVTDALIDRRTRRIVDMDKYLAMIRERGMVTGLSTHTPEAPVYADETGLDVATYIQIYNAAGFLMQVEVDWIHRTIWQCKKPVITIKPLAAGRLLPLVGLAFVWATLRDQDMVTIGTQTPDEAREVIELSLSLLERRGHTLDLQETRSKASVKRGETPVVEPAAEAEAHEEEADESTA